MILIPEIEKVVLLVPRTGTTSLSDAIKDRYPLSMRIYRHMEADGVPFGYDRWEKVGVIRNPLHRLFSVYKACQEGTFTKHGTEEYKSRMAASVDMPFDQWILENKLVFTNPYGDNNQKYYPRYSILHPMPENEKSQFFYLRPDLGTKIFKYNELDKLENYLDIKLPHENASREEKISYLKISNEATSKIFNFHKWDIDNF